MSSFPLRRVTQVGVVAALVAGGSGVAIMDKAIALDVDGETTTVHAFGGTVGDVLDKQGIELAEHDVVTPEQGAGVEDGQTIVVRYARELTLTVDGEEKTYWTTASTVGDALKELGIRGSEDAVLSASRSQSIGRDGLELELKTPKAITLVDGGKKTNETVHGANVSQALRELELTVGADDRLKPGKWSDVEDGMTIKVDRVNRKNVVKTETIPFETVVKEDSSKAAGTTTVETEGKAGVREVTWKVTYRNGTAVYQKASGSEVTTKAVNKVVIKGTKPAPAPSPAPSADSGSSGSSGNSGSGSSSDSGSGSTSSSGAGIDLSNAAMWDRIAQCESTGNWSINTGNGYYGGLQFDLRTWTGAGGGDFAPRADLASRAEQITVANRVYADRGLQPWGCGHAA